MTNKAIYVDQRVVFAQLRLRLFTAGWYGSYWLVERLKLSVKCVPELFFCLKAAENEDYCRTALIMEALQR